MINSSLHRSLTYRCHYLLDRSNKSLFPLKHFPFWLHLRLSLALSLCFCPFLYLIEHKCQPNGPRFLSLYLYTYISVSTYLCPFCYLCPPGYLFHFLLSTSLISLPTYITVFLCTFLYQLLSIWVPTYLGRYWLILWRNTFLIGQLLTWFQLIYFRNLQVRSVGFEFTTS